MGENQIDIAPGGPGSRGGTLRVAIAGEFSTGKSSVLNLLARGQFVPVSVGYSDLPPVRLGRGPAKALFAVRDGVRVPIESFESLAGTMPERIDVEVPNPELEGLSLTEIPHPPSRDFAAHVLPALRSFDTVIWCTSANQAWKHSELTAIEQLPPDLLARSVLVVTRADLLSKPDLRKVAARLTREAGGMFAKMMFLAASRRICDSAEDAAIWTRSGAESLVNTLRAQASALPVQPPEPKEQALMADDRPAAGAAEADGKVKAKQASGAVKKAAKNPRKKTKAGDAAATPSTPTAAAPAEGAAQKSTQVDNPSAALSGASRAEPEANASAGTASYKTMENVMKEQDLSALKDLNGFIGACLVDCDSGIMLGNEGGGSLDLEVAGAANAEVVKAKNAAIKALGLKETIEDILISLGGQYHLIRPLASNPQIFLYVAMDRSKANLGLARASVRQLEGRLNMK